MNGNDHNEMHELLCAYVLGEASAEEAQRVERALNDSSELRDEKARLEQTIGLVQGAFTGNDKLSDERLTNILSAAGSEPAPVIQFGSRAPALRAAAAVLVAAGGVFGVLEYAPLNGGAGDGVFDIAALDVDPEVESIVVEMTQIERDNGIRFGRFKRKNAERQQEILEFAKEALATGDFQRADQLAQLLTIDDPTHKEALALGERAVRDGLAALEDATLISNDARDSMADEAAGEPVRDDTLVALPNIDAGTVGKPLYGLPITTATDADPGANTPAAAGTGGLESIDFRGVPLLEAGSGDFYLGQGDTGNLYHLERDIEPVTELGSAVLGIPVTIDQTLVADKSRFGSGGAATRRGAGGVSYVGPGDTVAPGVLGSGGSALSQNISPSAGPGSPGPVNSPGPPAAKLPADELRARSKKVKAGRLRERALAESSAAPASPGAGLFMDSEGAYDALLTDKQVAEEKRSGIALHSEHSADLKELGYRGGEEALGKSRPGESLFFGRREAIHSNPEVLLRARKADRERIELSIRNSGDHCIRSCYPRPNEKPSAMYYRFWGDNAFELSQLDSQSTFSVDVDTASYALARSYINKGLIPEKAQIRTEEFLNYFDADVPAPTEGTFAIQTELAPSLFGGREDRWMLRVGIRGMEIPEEERQPLALTFVIDTSGSMKENNRMGLVKHALRLLVNKLDARDSISLVAYSGEARLVLPMTPVSQRNVIESAIHPLTPDGSTNAEAGLRMGYAQAVDNLRQGTHNRVVFLSDGVANVGQTDQDRLNADIKRFRDQGIYLNTIGVGMGNHNDVFLEQLANKGDGICDYIDDEAAAHRAIVERFSGAFQPIASDVKVQVEFDSNQVFRYRLLGYENRAIADADFRNDAVDAGEVGSGHQVVALYEIERTTGSGDGPLATVNLRWKAPKIAGQDPNEVVVTEIKSEVLAANAGASFDAASLGYRRSILVGQFAEILRRSTHAERDSFDTLLKELLKLENELKDPDFTEFCLLVSAVGDLMWRQPISRSELQRTVDEYRRFRILNHELSRLKKDLDGELLKELERTNNGLENRIRDLIRSEVQTRNG